MKSEISSEAGDPPTAAEQQLFRESCNRAMSQQRTRLAHMAFTTLVVDKLSPKQFVLICAEVDSKWRVVVDPFLPDTNWDSERGPGKIPIARILARLGQMNWFLDVMNEHYPSMRALINGSPPKGHVRCFLLRDMGFMIYDIRPKRDTRQ